MITVSMSLMNKLFHHGNYREEVCLKKILATSIEARLQEKPSDSQAGGLFFEGLTLGESAGKGITDLGRKPNGEKKIKQERIEQQALQFKVECVKNFINVAPGVNTQVKIYKRFTDYIFITGVLDIFPTSMLYKGEIVPMVIIDLKLTEDLDSTFGEYSWGRVEDMDHTQLTMYHYLVKDFDVELNTKMNSRIMRIFNPSMIDLFNEVQTFYWVFEHGKKLRNQFFKVNQDNYRINELKELIRKTASLIDDEYSKSNGWAPNPSYDQCKNCPLNYLNGGTCREAQIIKEI